MSGRGAASWVGQVLAWLVILGVVAVVTAAVLVPRLAGATPYAVLTGSMRPDLPPGTLVVVRPTAVEDIRIGDVVTYQLRSGEPEVVTHRVVAVGSNGLGERTFQTQGDANDAPDEEWVRAVQVKGRVWYAVPYVGHANDMLDGDQRHLAVLLVAGGLVTYAGVMFGSAALDRRRRTAPAETPAIEEEIAA